MRLVDQVTLVFTRGRSEKVYEIDLCAVGGDRFVVNYRYGRRGKPLKEGTQTVEPVSEAKARAEFRKLVEQKQAQGYVGGPSFAPAPPEPEPEPEPAPAPPEPARPAPPPTPTRTPRVDDPLAQAVFERLARGDRPKPRTGRQAQPEETPTRGGRTRREIQAALRAQRRRGRGRGRGRRERRSSGGGDWSLTRAMWRAGELGLTEAGPMLVSFIGTDDAMRDYCAAWALTRCGDASAVGALMRLYRDPGTPPHVARAAAGALLALFGPDEKAAFVDSLRHRLPAALRGDGGAELEAALRAHLAGPPQGDDEAPTPFGERDRKKWAAIETLYLIGTPAARDALLGIIPDLPLRPPAFKQVRALFKLAEQRRDPAIFGAIAHRFATTRAMFDISRRGWAWTTSAGGRGRRIYDHKRALRSVDAEIAYGSRTRDYLRRRTWRTLKRLGELDSDDYVPLAVGVLLGYTDADRDLLRTDKTFQRIVHDRDREPYRTAYSRRERRRNRRRESEPQPRGEAFKHLWDRRPAGLMQLIDGSRCGAVHAFAAGVLGEQTVFLDALPPEALTILIGAHYGVSARLGARLARDRWRRGGLSAGARRTLGVAMALSVEAEARRTGLGWLEREPQLLIDAPGELARLAACKYDDVWQAMRDLLRGMRFDSATARTLTGGLLAHVMGLEDSGMRAVTSANRLIGLIDDHFTAALAALGPQVIDDLARHPLAVVQSFAARLMADGLVPLAPSALGALLGSDHPEVRVAALRVLGRVDDAALREANELLWTSLIGRDPAVRDAARPIVRRLAARDAAFGGQFLQMLIASLLRRRLPDGVPAFVVQVLREDFADALRGVPAEVAWRLLRSKDGAAQELGGLLLPHHLDPAVVSIAQLVELADHEVKAVREAAWQAMREAVPRLKAALGEAVGVLDSRWEDTRLFAFDLFEARFEYGDFAGEDGATVLVSICDSVRPDVQRFGRRLISRHFDPAHGQRYLLELSEHPSSDVQLFASNYLRAHAAGDPETLARLAPYFVRVLCGINRGRAAKRRAHAFLRDEALADRRCAEIVAGILTRQSATTAIEDRAACIDTMAAIHRRWPEVQLPIRVVPISAVSAGAAAERGA